jgi:hypothetical protein
LPTPAGSGANPPIPLESSRARWALVALIATAALLRWLAWERTAAIFNDGPRFLAIAQAIGAGDWSSALRDSFHPLYPAAVAGVAWLLPASEWESAGAIVSVVGGAAAVGFAFAFLRDAFGAMPAWIGASLLAVHSRAIEYASDVQSDGLYLGLFAAGLWLAWRAWSRASAGWAAAAGAASGLAYLARPEGLGLAALLGALGAIEGIRGRWPARATARWLCALCAGAILTAAPYVLALQWATGDWALTHKKPAGTLAPASGAPAAGPAWAGRMGPSTALGIDPAWVDAALDDDGQRVRRAATPVLRVAEALRMLARTARSSLRYGVLALVALGLVHVARSRGGVAAPRPGRFIAVLVGAYAVLLFALTVSEGYVSRRHALPPLLPLFGYAGLGAVAAGAWLARAAGRTDARAAGLAAALVLALVGGGELATRLEPKRADQRAARSAAEWLQANAPGPGRIAAERQRIGYYAGMPYVPLGGVAAEALGAYLAHAGARYVVLDDPERIGALLRSEEVAVRALHHQTVSGRDAWVFELGPAGGAAAPGTGAPGAGR